MSDLSVITKEDSEKMQEYQETLLNIYYLAMRHQGIIGKIITDFADEIIEKIEATGITICSFCNKPILRGQQTKTVYFLRYHASCFEKLQDERKEYLQFVKKRKEAEA